MATFFPNCPCLVTVLILETLKLSVKVLQMADVSLYTD